MPTDTGVQDSEDGADSTQRGRE
eukprot:COSAG03_NODE_20355_length_320_cov_1.325792_1_plen_22_part_10